MTRPFAARRHEVSRLEGFSDAVFGFALTLLVVSLEVPKTFTELQASMRGFVAFAICFTLLFQVWWRHYKFFRRYGPWIVLFGRLLPIIRTLISIPAGLSKMPAWQFFGFSLIGMVVWNTILAGAGYVLAEHYHLIEAWLDPLTWLVLGSVVILYFYRLVTWRPSRS